MEPIRTKRYASAQGFSPETAPNTAAQQRRRDEQFIKEYREVKDLEIQQEATALAQLKERNRLERENLSTNALREKEYEDQQAKLQLQKLEREADLQRRVAGADSSNSKFNNILDTVVSLSNTAAKAATQIGGQIQKEQEAAGSAAGARDALLGQQTANLGSKAQETALDQVSFEQESAASQADILGQPNVAFKARSGNSWYDNAYNKAYAGVIGQSYAQKRLAQYGQEQIDNPDKEYTIGGQKVRIGEVDLSNAQDLDSLLRADVPAFLEENGLGGLTDLALGDFYGNAGQSIGTVVGTVRGAQINEQKADRRDKVKNIFQMNPTPMNAKLTYNTANQTGFSDKQAREFMTSSWTTLTNEQFIAMGDMPFGPNELSFREQYPEDWQAAVTKRNQFIQSERAATEFEFESNNAEFLLDFKAQEQQDIEDGSYDADPELLTEIAQAREAVGDEAGAAYVRSRINFTSSARYDNTWLDQQEEDLAAGVSNYTIDQVMANPSLSVGAKKKAVAAIKKFNETAVPSDIKTADKGILDSYIDNRGKVNTFQKGPAHPSVKIMKDKAWNRYTQVFSQMMVKTGGDVEASRAAAKADFMAEFGTDDTKGEYAVKPALSGASSGQYVNGTITGKAFSSGNYINKVEETFQTKGTQRALSEPDLYPQEKEELTTMLKGVGTGKITVPPTFYAIAKQSGGQMSVRQLT